MALTLGDGPSCPRLLRVAAWWQKSPNQLNYHRASHVGPNSFLFVITIATNVKGHYSYKCRKSIPGQLPGQSREMLDGWQVYASTPRLFFVLQVICMVGSIEALSLSQPMHVNRSYMQSSWLLNEGRFLLQIERHSTNFEQWTDDQNEHACLLKWMVHSATTEAYRLHVQKCSYVAV